MNKLEAKGKFINEPFTLTNNFISDPNPYEKKFAGIVSSKGGHSYHLVSYADDFFIKFWLIGITKSCEFTGDKNKLPHITFQMGKKDKILKENNDLKVSLLKHDFQIGKSHLIGKVIGKWDDSSEVEINFDVVIEDKGLL